MSVVGARLIRPPQQLHLARVARVPFCLRPTGVSIRSTQLHTARRYYSPPSPIRLQQKLSPRRSAIDPLSLLAAALVSGGAFYLYTSYISSSPQATLSADNTDNQNSASSKQSDFHENTMAPYELPPGRPGNLTPEQEQKLKEMWVALLDVIGVAHETSETPGVSPTNEGDKKQSKGGMFGGKKHEDQGNDKHGQKKEFQQALASQKPEEIRDSFWNMTKSDNPDALMLRFLRARKWDVQAALVMLISTLHWRDKEMHVDDEIMKLGEGHAIAESNSSNLAARKEGEDFMAQLRLGKSFLHGVDKAGRPCCYVRVRLHKAGDQTEKSQERFTVWTIETCRLLLGPNVDTATIIFDMTDFGLSNMDYAPVKFMIKCFEANYPESLGTVLVHKSPWLFSSIWRVIKGWLDPVVAGKVHFTSNLKELAEFLPQEHIITELGGPEKFTFKYTEPAAGAKEDARLEDTETRDKLLGERAELYKEYEKGTLDWIHEKATMQSRVSISERLQKNYWQVDPYVRARSLYDRIGVLSEGGKVDPYPASGAA